MRYLFKIIKKLMNISKQYVKVYYHIYIYIYICILSLFELYDWDSKQIE